MIVVNNINGRPEYVPSTPYIMQVFDGNSFTFLETDQEVSDFYASLPQIDPRLDDNYYQTRAENGRKFVNEVTTNLLTSYYNGQRTFQEIMTIEELLEKVIDKINDGNFLSAKYKLMSVVGLEQQLYDEIIAGIDNRIAILYPSLP